MATNINMLPEDCVSAILSLTNPRDASRFSSVSSRFRSTAESNFLWDRFLPPDYRDILRRAVGPLKFSSKKELYFCLSKPILIDGATKSFQLDKCSGKKSYILSARELSIGLITDPMHCTWKSLPESRFSDVAELTSISRLQIHGKIKTPMLSHNTTYGAYLIIKLSDRSYGLDSIPCEVFVQIGGNQVCASTTYLCAQDPKKQQMEQLMYGNRREATRKRMGSEGAARPRERPDGWLEVELGEFFNGGDDDEEVKMSLMEVKGYQLKGGLRVEGIEVRPKHVPI